MREAHEKVPMRLTGFCLLTNHFHLLLWPHEDGDLSRWMQWLMTSHVRRYHRHDKGSGHVWQERFKTLPVQSDEYYLTVLRYVERVGTKVQVSFNGLGAKKETCPPGQRR